MHYDLKYNSEFNYVEVISIGEFAVGDYKVEIEEAARFGRVNNTMLFLVNNTQLVNTASISDIYKVPKFYRDLAPEKELKIAALFSESLGNKESISFYENICVNQGINLSTFFQRDEALRWLLSK